VCLVVEVTIDDASILMEASARIAYPNLAPSRRLPAGRCASLGGFVFALGVLAFGVVVGWWTVSLTGWAIPSRRAVLGAVGGVASALAVVVLLAGASRLLLGGLGIAVGAAVHAAFLAVVVLATKLRGSS